jgi:hypothetical protein
LAIRDRLSPQIRRFGARWAAGGASLALILSVVAVGAPGATGCTTHQCDSSTLCVFPDEATRAATVTGFASSFSTNCPSDTVLPPAQLISRAGDDLVWDTAPLLQGPWLDYGPNATLAIFFPPELVGHPLVSVTSWISADAPDAVAPDASVSGRNYINGSGQIAEYTLTTGSSVNVFNDTCATYSIRLQITVYAPLDPASDMSNAGDVASADAASTDAANVDAPGNLADATPEAAPLSLDASAVNADAE